MADSGEGLSPLKSQNESEGTKKVDEANVPLAFQLEEATRKRGFFDIYRFAGRGELILVLCGTISAIVNGAVQPLQAILMGRIWGGKAGLDSHVLQNQINENLKWMMLLGVVAFVANYVQFACFMVTSERILQRFKRTCLASLMRQEIGFFDANPSGLLSARINEQSILVQRGTAEALGTAIQFSAQVVAGFVVSFMNNAKVAVAMLICMPAIVIILSGLIMAVIYFIKKTTRAYEDAGAIAEETLKGIQTVASFNAEQKCVSKYDKFLAIAEKIGSKMWFVRSIGMGLIFSSIFFNIGIGYWWGGVLISRGGEDFGGIFTSVMSALMGSVALGVAGPNIGFIAQGKAAASVLYRLIDREPKIKDGNLDVDVSRARGTVEFRNVVFSYPTRPEKRALGGLSFSVKAGQTCSLVGESGCGKSSAIALLQRWYDADSGSILVDGIDVREYKLQALRSIMGFVSQEPILWDTSIADNIRMGKPSATMEEVQRAAKAADAHDFISQLPHGYLTRVGGQGNVFLSGGQKQRIAIARALVRDPCILILDEATSALDENSQRTVQDAIDRILRPDHGPRRTALVIAHRLSTVKRSDVIVVLENQNNRGGTVCEIGTHETLMQQNGVYANLVSTQENAARNLNLSMSSLFSSPARHSPARHPSGRFGMSPVRLGASPSKVLNRSSSLLHSPSILQLQRQESTMALNSALAGAGIVLTSPTRALSFQDEVDTQQEQEHEQSLLATPSKVSNLDNSLELPLLGGMKSVELQQSPADIPVPTSRIWKLSAPEAPWWFVLGFFGSALKGCVQPMVSIAISHVLSHMILIPKSIEGLSPWPCKSDADCGPRHPFCLKDILPVPLCVKPCQANSDCFKPGSTCINLQSMNIDAGLCVPPGAWMDGHSPEDVRHTGVLALEIYAGVGLLMAIGMACQTFAFGIIGERLVRRVRLMVFRSIVAQDAEFFDNENNSVGSLLSRLANDATMIRAMTSEYTGMLVENGFAVVAALIISFVSNWQFSVVFFLTAPLLGFSTFWQHHVLSNSNKAGSDVHKTSAGILNEAIANVRTVYSFNAENKVVNLFEDAMEEPKRVGIRNAHISGIGSGTSQFLFFLTYSIGFLWGGHLIAKGILRSQDLSRGFMAITLSAQSIGTASARANDFSKAKVAVSKVFRLVDRRPRIEAIAKLGKRFGNDFKAHIKFEDVRFRYPSRPEVQVLNGLTFEAKPGETVALVGRSGCGKSSVIKLLLRFYDCEDDYHSRILINDVDLRDIDLVWFRSQVGLVGQEPVLFRGTIRENLHMGDPTASEERLRSALKAANALDFINRLPGGLDADLGANAKGLSGGEKQRIAIARALIKNPTILCLDEATSALDSESEKIVQAALDRLLAARSNSDRKRTTIVIAHRLSTIRNADKIVVLGNPDAMGGRVVEQGTHADLLKIADGQYKAMWEMTSGSTTVAQ